MYDVTLFCLFCYISSNISWLRGVGITRSEDSKNIIMKDWIIPPHYCHQCRSLTFIRHKKLHVTKIANKASNQCKWKIWKWLMQTKKICGHLLPKNQPTNQPINQPTKHRVAPIPPFGGNQGFNLTQQTTANNPFYLLSPVQTPLKGQYPLGSQTSRL